MNVNKFVLASSSPRRRELIKLLDVCFSLVSPGIAERPPQAGENPLSYCAELAYLKASNVAISLDRGQLAIGADTVVTLDSRIMGKPIDNVQAVQMLQTLKGRTHLVHTAIAVVRGRSHQVKEKVTTTRVTMRNYSDEEISEYIATGDFMDKAGAYAIQHPVFIPAEKIEGCYLSVVGLPICELLELLNSVDSMPKVKLKIRSRQFDKCTQCPLSESGCDYEEIRKEL